MSTPDAQLLALTIGDPAGIGPELVAECWRACREDQTAPALVVVGSSETLKAAAQTRGFALPCRSLESVAEARDVWPDALPVLELGSPEFAPGEPSAEGAEFALRSLETATRLALDNEIAGVVTAPIAKDNLAAAGFRFAGQTEFFAGACDIAEEDAVMMLAGPRLRTVPMTVHCALADVPRRLSVETIVRRSVIVAEAFQTDFGIERPRLAVAGLNPHAGENGRFGAEEIEIIVPAIAALKERGIDVSGPHPGDALFTPRARETYDVAIAMYHDQALIPLKALDFDEGVNVTLGLPIVRTSPDHGTAFSIAGKNLADPGAMLAAVRMASQIAAIRQAQ
ncbi:4-hydroxythreonine-4-phosphate dehydrogenase PdxA [Altererythrobacter aurantiacus]|uniref:4-hydroxythreonine-4-phosphate dehydrogenase n=1 Tax=Parapontixanthobacter aurantiacus TaxID=1463599 RepID=A0A844ZEU3_9SPHN|nr:4-hydroxythreonine-4-phosphate dehydrogenase PdxA [Parapontixanthobacter aurantiacus]MXO85752.1 4-hydroxythreonine-4-phosphate dehydrogenase PdxA [Parapontixanthobacter aurantiacus]